jgi:DNA-binding HxlR family transcriptional regulator
MIARPEWDSTLVRQLSEVLVRRWSIQIVELLWEKPLRRSVLSRQLDGISEKILTETLRDLMSRGYVLRRYFEGTPPRVTYRLSPRGYALGELLASMTEWATEVDHAIPSETSSA